MRILDCGICRAKLNDDENQREYKVRLCYYDEALKTVGLGTEHLCEVCYTIMADTLIRIRSLTLVDEEIKTQ